MLVRIRDDDVDVAALAARPEHLGPGGAEHHDSVAEAELGVEDAAVVGRVYGVTLAAERGAQELDRRVRVVVPEGRKDCRVLHRLLLSLASNVSVRKPRCACLGRI
jgi:hypothetical protein